MTAFYNEFDGHAAQWLRNLSGAGLIAAGEVDERSISDVVPNELAGFAQCHFFAGIGVWSYALRKAGWPDDREVWTGSCPCQPFSAAGARGGFADERHLWPHWFHLIEQRRPATIFGEQVASKDGLAWLDLVCSDLEGAGYSVAAFDLCAAGFGAPHIRQRLFFVATRMGDAASIGRDGRRAVGDDVGSSSATGFVADASGERRQGERLQLLAGRSREAVLEASGRRAVGDMANPKSLGLLGRQDNGDARRRERASRQGCEAGELADADGRLSGDGALQRGGEQRLFTQDSRIGDQRAAGPVNGFWQDADWIGCTDGKWRAVEPGAFPLVDGSSFKLGSGGAYAGKSRSKMLRGYGNAIVAEVATEFVRAYLECRQST